MRELTQEEIMLGNAAFTSKLNVVHHAYVDICDDLTAGMLLSQILYWFGADRNGRPRARIVRDGHLWIAKARGDWWDEIRISPKQYDRAIRILVAKDFVELRTMKFNGNPTTHIRIKSDRLNHAIDEWKREQATRSLGQGLQNSAVVGFSPFGNNDVPQPAMPMMTNGQQGHSPLAYNNMSQGATSLTEITTENTIESTTEHTRIKGAGVLLFSKIWDAYPKKIGRSKAERAYVSSVAKGANPFAIYAEVVLFAQYVYASIDHEGLEWRYVPTGGVWFDEERWKDDTKLIGKYLGFDAGLEYNKRASRLRALAVHAPEQSESEQRETLAAMHEIMAELPY